MTCRHLLLPLLIGVASAQPPSADDKGSIEGVVTEAATGERLRKAYVTLGDAHLDVPTSVSGADGRFAFTGLAPGDYTLHVKHQDFIDLDFSSNIHLAAGQKIADIRLALTRFAAISGRVVDPDGDPWPNAQAAVFRMGWTKGKRHLQQQSDAAVDDRGEFRIGQLKPGRYYVLATTQQEGLNLPTAFQPTWYPSDLDPAGASPLVVRAGQEMNGIEVQLKAGVVHRILGRVVGLQRSNGAGPAQSAPEEIMVMMDVGKAGKMTVVRGVSLGVSIRASRSSSLVEDSQVLSGSVKPGGEFEIQGVTPGTYEVRLKDGANEGKTTVVVRDEDVKNVLIQVTPLRSIHGRIRIDGQPDASLTGVLVSFSSGGEAFEMLEVRAVKEDGSFESPPVAAGRYSVTVTGKTPGPLCVKAVRVGARELPNRLLDTELIGDGPVEVVVGRGGKIRGTLKTDSAAGFANIAVLLIPDDPNAERREFGVLAAVLESDGAFTIQNIPSGEYKLIAWPNLPEGAWLDGDFWREMEGKGLKVPIAESDDRQIELPLISPAETAALLARLGIE
jgi:Carboxypeptidase regulatory-like domain